MIAQATQSLGGAGLSADWWLVIVTVFFGVISVMQGIGLYFVSVKAGKIDTLEATITHKAQEVIDGRFALLAAEFQGAAKELRLIVGGMQDRLEDGDEAFDRQGIATKELEIKAVTKEAAIKEWAHNAFGSRAEMASIGERLARVELNMARFEERVMQLEKQL